MTEDQSVVGRRRIYYDQNGGEALICSDSEEELIEEEEKKEFVDSEDYILRLVMIKCSMRFIISNRGIIRNNVLGKILLLCNASTYYWNFPWK